MAGLVAGIRRVRCRQWEGCRGGSKSVVPVIGWGKHAVLEGCRVAGEGTMGGKIGMVAGDAYRRGPVQGMMPVECSRCPEGGVGWCVVECQSLHQGEADLCCWGYWGKWRGDNGKGKG